MQFSREQSVIITGSLLTLAAIGTAAALYWTSSVMMPFVLSILVSYLVAPMVDFVQVRLRAPRWLAVLSALLVIAGGISLLTLLLWTSIKGLAANSDLYAERISAFGTMAQQQLERLPNSWVPADWKAEELDIEGVIGNLDVRPLLGTLGNTAGGVLQTMSVLVANALLVTLFAVYLVSGRTPTERTGVMGDIDRQIRRYLLTKFVMSLVTGVSVWVILAILGLDLALVFGFLAFLLNFIPSVGSIIATFLPLPIALMQFQSPVLIVLAVVLPGAVQTTIGNVIEPKVMGDNLDLHPITVLTTLIFWGLLWGPVGMVLATPLTAVMKLVAARFETTYPVAELLAGRFVFEPPPVREEDAEGAGGA